MVSQPKRFQWFVFGLMGLLLACQLVTGKDAGILPLPSPTASIASITLVKIPKTTITPLTTATPSPPSPTFTTTPTSSPSTTPTPTATSSPTATAAPACLKTGELTVQTYQSPINGASRYRQYLPPCYGEDGRVYPAIYLLHGSGQSDSTWEVLGLIEEANAGILSGDYPPFIFITPLGGWAHQNTSGGAGSYEAVVMNELIPRVEAEVCAWQDGGGRAIGGISRGGYWALEIAFRHPDQFASVGGHSASLLDQAAGPNLNPRYTGFNNELGDLRVYLDVGNVDHGSRPNLEPLHDDMENAGIPHEWHLNIGGHNSDYWTKNLEDYLAWYTAVWPRERKAYEKCRHSP